MKRLVLVGFMGSGKSTVGPLLARRLGWRFADLDAEVERRAGRTVPEIFREQGEAAFRELERRAAEDLLVREELVLATGGGWGAAEGSISGLDEETLVVWLRISAGEAIRRARREAELRGAEGKVAGAGSLRPLLDTPDPLGAAQRLLALREPLYRRAALHVDTRDRDPEDIAREIVAELNSDPGRIDRA